MKENSFTEGKILSPLLRFSMPIFLALFLQAMYGGVDLIAIGQFGDASGVAAVATGSQVMQTITGIVTGLTMGITVLLGQRIGEKRFDEAGKVIGSSICIFTIVALLITCFMLIFLKSLVALMQVPTEAYDQTVQYIFVCSIGTIFIVGYNVISGIFRGMGNSKLPLLFVAIACVANIIGNIIFVGFFKMGAIGTACATVLAQGMSVAISIAIIKKQKFPFNFSRKHIKFYKEEVILIFKLGTPIALQDALTNVSFLIIIGIINTMGVIAAASVGVGEKVGIFFMLIPIAYMSSISAFVAQNVGANQIERAKKAMLYGMGTSLFIGIIMFVLGFFKGETLAGFFSTDPAVIKMTANYLKAYSIDSILVSVIFCFLGYFNGCGKTFFVMIQGICCTFLVRIPYSYFMSKVEGVSMFQIGLATPFATIFGIILCLVYYRKMNLNKSNLIETELVF